MVKMGNVWDRTVEVLNGRGGMLAGLAVLTLFVPAVVSAAFKSFAPPSVGTAIVGLVLTVLVAIAALWGQLAIIAASSDPSTDRAAATAQANRRLAPAIGIAVVLALVMIAAFMPAFVLLVQAGIDWMAVSRGAQPVVTAPAAAGFASLYAIVLGIVLLFVGARFLPLYAVILHERLGLGAIARCWRLTRRHTWRLVGTILLFLIVLLIASWAAQSVVGLVFRLALGAGAIATATFLGALAAQAVSTALTLVAIVFSAQLYIALVARERLLQARAAQVAPEQPRTDA